MSDTITGWKLNADEFIKIKGKGEKE